MFLVQKDFCIAFISYSYIHFVFKSLQLELARYNKYTKQNLLESSFGYKIQIVSSEYSGSWKLGINWQNLIFRIFHHCQNRIGFQGCNSCLFISSSYILNINMVVKGCICFPCCQLFWSQAETWYAWPSLTSFARLNNVFSV